MMKKQIKFLIFVLGLFCLIGINTLTISANTEKYYIYSSYNNYLLDDSSLLKENLDGSYEIELTNVKAFTQYSITDKVDTWKSEGKNQGTDFLIKDAGNYLVKFYKEGKDNVYSEVIKLDETKYYLVGKMGDQNLDELLLTKLEDSIYGVKLDVEDTTLFHITDHNKNYYNRLNQDYIIKEKGSYLIKFQIKELTHKVEIIEDDSKESKYYICGSFNEYKMDDKSLLSYNDNETDYIEFFIIMDLNQDDSFYITDGITKYNSPDGEDLKINVKGRYIIKFSKQADYGNGYNIYYKLKNQPNLEEEIIKVSNKDELNEVIKNCTIDSYSFNKQIEITNDIDMENMTISSIAVFSGILNGNFHRIYNFNLDNNVVGSNLGFIRTLNEDGIVKNLTLEYSVVNENSDIIFGGVVAKNNGLVYNCKYYGYADSLNIVGGIVGNNTSTGQVISCINYAKLIGNTFLGGVVGYNEGKVLESNNYGLINQVKFPSSRENKVANVGGICGASTGKVINCYNHGNIGSSQTGSFIGGVIGGNIGELVSCYNSSTVIGNNHVGGICGHYAEFTNIKDDDTYNAIIDYVNSILQGKDDNKEEDLPEVNKKNIKSTLKYCYNTGIVSGELSVGGIAGYIANSTGAGSKKDNFNVYCCYNTGDITSTNSYVGGIVGQALISKISDCFNVGTIESISKSYIGGIAGYSTGEISACFALCNIKGDSYLGGIAGYGNNINNCYTIVNIYKTGNYVGAISGDVKDINELSNNYFVFTGFYGVSNISYESAAVLVEREKLASYKMLEVGLDYKKFMAGPKEMSYPILRSMFDENADNLLSANFKETILDLTSFTCNLTFCDDDGEIIEIIKIDYGTDFDLAKLPNKLEKEGYFSKFEDFDTKNITNDLVIKMVYIEKIYSISSNDENIPLLLLEGEFYPDATVDVNILKENYLATDSKYNLHGTYEFTLNDKMGQSSINKIKIKCPENIKEPLIMVLKDNKLILVDSKIDGSYLVFDNDNFDKFMIVSSNFFSTNNGEFIRIMVYSFAGVGFILFVTGITLIIISSKKRKKLNK